MIAEETWRRYLSHWGALALAGVFSMLVSLVPTVIARLILARSAFQLGLGASGVSGLPDMATILRAGAAMGAAGLVLAVAWIFLAPVAQGALLHAVLRAQRDQPAANFSELWQAGRRYWGPLFRLNLYTAAIVLGLLLVLAVLVLVPLLGPLVWFIGFAMIMLVLVGYGPYMLVHDDLGATEAVGRAFRILSAKFADVLLALLVLAVGYLVVELIAGLLGWIPLLGRLVPYLRQIFVTPLVVLYIGVRYQRNIMGPPGGHGTFSPGPPAGV